MEVKHGIIKRTEEFKYLEECVQPKGLGKDAIRARARKFELVAYSLTQNRYNKGAYPARRHSNTIARW